MRKRRKIITVSTAVAAAATLPLLMSPVVSAAVREDDDESSRMTRLYAPPPDRDSYRQVARLAWRGDFRDSAGLLSMVRTPQAVWYGDETPEQVERLVRRTTRSADWQGRLPVLALYNVPGRDCGSYSSGGADSLAEYEAWIDAVAAGIGDREVLIILEPDSLALLPSDCADASNAAQTAVEQQTVIEEQTTADEQTAADGQSAADGQPAAQEQPAAEESPTELPPLPDPGASTAPPTGSAAPGTGQEAAQTPGQQLPDALPATSETPAPKPPEVQEPAALEPSASQTPAPEPSTEQPGTLPELPPLPTPDPVTPEPGNSLDPDELDTPVVEDPETAARYSEINYAVDVLTALGQTSVYLDAGHAGWHSVSSIVPRLIKAGIDRATGFALNVSHYQTDPDSTWYGRLISSCLAYADEGGDPEKCADQSWSRRHARRWLRAHAPDDPAGMKHYVTDTSRNGQGPWTPRDRHIDAQSWCNPPGRGLGRRPTTHTGDALMDAALWVKTPGESDGRCLRGTDGPLDPVRGTVNPEAGEWFPDQALELVRYADPAVKVFRRTAGR
ncbi:glycoside hydrolase family 6 protein [Streptomyces malaysiensis]|uniref:glycoside hydrolase family 6 protein n=1 Tax=Streptomyces malaysiensis TaxID=92644 RepID=UPI000853EF5E|nr:glycoside hydrolase family 6 protein [Streptomyces sp. SPMA113]